MTKQQRRILTLLASEHDRMHPNALQMHWHPVTFAPWYAYVGDTKVDKRAAATLCRGPYLRLHFSMGGKRRQIYMITREGEEAISEAAAKAPSE